VDERQVEQERDVRGVHRGAVDLLDGAVSIAQFPLRVMGLLSRHADTVENEMAGGRRLLRFPDRADEGWEEFELFVPTEIELWFANTSIRTRTALFWCDGPLARLEAELEALGAHRSERRRGDWVLPTESEQVEARVGIRDSRAVLMVRQRRSYADLEAAVKAQLHRMTRPSGIEPDDSHGAE